MSEVQLTCPSCGSIRIAKSGQHQHTGQQRYKCKNKTCKLAGGEPWKGVDPIGIDAEQAKGLPTEDIDELEAEILDGRWDRLVITTAQNATPVWTPFMETLKGYCKFNRAKLLVIPHRYHNPTSLWSKKAQSHDWWDARLTKSLYDRRTDLCENLTLMGDIKTQPTAPRPLSALESLSGGLSAVVGHPKLELKVVATPHQKLPKVLVTTGCVTKKNYTPTKAGAKADFHHTFGAVVVELDPDGKRFYMRHLNATRSGSFCDIDYNYTPDGQRSKIRADIVLGDVHDAFIDEGAARATFDKGGIIDTVKPKNIVWHDVHDFYSRNHHHKFKFFTNFAKHHQGLHNVERELDNTFRFVDKVSPPDAQNIFVYSNHPDALARWVNGTDPRDDPENAVFWAETFAIMCKSAHVGEHGTEVVDPFEYWARKKLKSYGRSKFLALDESFTIRSIECGYHGHIGPSGTRGALSQFAKIGAKTIIGHKHTPGIIEGAYQVGTTSKLKMEYNHGPNSWLHCHCLIYPNGKRALVIIIGDKWRS